MPPSVALKLAVAAVAGQFNVVEFGKETKYVLGPSAPAADTREGLRETWRVLRAALTAVAEPLYGVRFTDPGIAKVEARVGATVGSLRMEAKAVHHMLRRVFEQWGLECRRFRQSDGEKPSFQRCVEAHSNFFNTKAAAAAIRQEFRLRGEELDFGRRTDGRQEGRSTLGKRKEDDVRKGGADLFHRESGGRPVEKNGEGGLVRGSHSPQSAWPNKPRMEGEKFERFCEAVRKGCGESCRFFLIGRCKKTDCNRPHKVTEAFRQIQKDFS